MMMNTVNVNKLLGIADAGASIAKAHLFQRFIKDMANVIILAIVTGFIAGALLIGGFYIAYQWLTRYGLDPFVAEIIIAVMSSITVLILISWTTLYLRRLRVIPGQIIHGEFPLCDRINKIVDSFLEGLLGES